MSVRRPAVAGTFYQSDAASLEEQVKGCFISPGGPGQLPSVNKDGPRRVVGLICPHAGLMYSGTVAAWAYYRLAEDGLPDVAVIIGPNHRSYLPAVALSDDDSWMTPLGEVKLDRGVTSDIESDYPPAEVETRAHYAEHSLEVQLPFLQYIAGQVGANIRIVPVLVGAAAGVSAPGGSVEVARQMGGAISQSLEGKNAVVIASTDFTHYETSESAMAKDQRAISAILALDENSLLDTVESADISMCGALPAAVAIVAAKKLGATSANQLAYRNSGDVTGDYREVVGYAALEIDR